ncbi:pyridoxal phosphate-dependent aminotransferase [Lutibacter sp. HS1-25]|uniref:pyridoxal phosphate-dependent aminotransferase n=1 Tax=Lutibacter sp. HS1-25 TaxID=2485000 RepID=UPI001011336D|nr:pyridoxal phosphate-dependent aminotransferase [Lutibacter sp. HS1-25]RXP55769.1 pyridoxal phosphate-dependent aminotransferase [Lutibacter sp. HS1-25]
MPKISNTGKNMPESPIRKLVPFAEKAKKNGIKVFHLNIGQPDIKTPSCALEAVKNNTIEVLAYSSTDGSPSYREKLANHYFAKNNIKINADDIIITTGGSEALLFSLGSITDPGDEIIIPEPFYANYNGFSSSLSVKIVPITSKIENNFALPDVEDFEKLITPKTKAILICNPGNPTGYCYSEAELQQLASMVKKHDIFLIADEVYREFIYNEDAKHHSVLGDFGLEEHAILIDSVSKRYSMCGARIGYLISRNKEVMVTARKFAQARLSPPTYAQIASEAALDTPKSYFDEVIVEYKGRRDLLIQELNKIEGVKATTPMGAFYCIVELPVDNAEKFSQWLLEDFSDNNETVMVAPAAGFYSTPGLGLNQVRVAYVLKKDDLKRSVALLKIALSKYNNK